MIAGYGLKVLEYLFYALASLAAVPLLKPGFIQPYSPSQVTALVFVLVGIGVLLPRAIAYSHWHRIVAQVGTYQGTLDGERTASYSYEVGDQRYTGSFRSMHGSKKFATIEVTVNPRAPWIRYPVFWNVWSFGTAMLATGLFLLVSGIDLIG